MKYKRTSIITEVLENRRNAVANMVGLGYSVEQIARFFECPVRGIKDTIEHAGLHPAEDGKKEDEMETLLDLRDMKIAEMSSAYGEKEALKRLGFTHVPYYRGAAKRIAEEHFAPELSDDAYMSAFNGIPKRDARKAVGMRQISQMEAAGYEYKAVAKRGEAYRNMEGLSFIVERLLNGTPQATLARDTGTKLSDLENLSEFMKPLRQEVKDRQMSQAKEYASGSCVFKDIQEFLGVTNQQLSAWGAELDLKSGKKTPFYDRREDFRKTCFEMYRSGMTQVEIASELGAERRSVGQAIADYKKDHPEEVDKTILWRQRNVDANHREVREMRKKLVLLHHMNGVSIDRIAKQNKMAPDTVKRYLNEQGVFPEPKNYLFERQLAKVRKYNEEGLSILDISKRMGITMTEVVILKQKLRERLKKQITKSDEMEMSWTGHSTTEIMGVVGRQRYSVLNDQHETSSVLRYNPDLLQIAKENNGDIKDHFLRTAAVKLPEHVEPCREI